MPLSWNDLLADQLDPHWSNFLGPRLDTLDDAAYLWKPVPGCWSIRRAPRGEPCSTTGTRPGSPACAPSATRGWSGRADGPDAAEPLAALVLHVNREALHHGSEIMLLLDLHERARTS
jgi:hypothetical protein